LGHTGGSLAALFHGDNSFMQSHFFAFSPSPSAIATSRRIASERLGSSSCDAAHLSTVSRSSFESLMAVTGSRPVAGRPRPFFWYYFI